MKTRVAEVIRNAHLFVETKDNGPITKYNPYLVNILQICVTDWTVLKEIPAKDARCVGIAFLHILDLTSESDADVYPIYAGLSFYFLQKYLLGEGKYLSDSDLYGALISMVTLISIRPKSFCEIIARAYGDILNNYALSTYFKKVPLLEYGYLEDMMKIIKNGACLDSVDVLLSREPKMRYDFLMFQYNSGYFEDVLNGCPISHMTNQIREHLFNYISMKIENEDIVF